MSLVASAESSNLKLVGLGGSFRALTQSFVGAETVRAIEGFYADRVVFSRQGHLRRGLPDRSRPARDRGQARHDLPGRDGRAGRDVAQVRRRGLNVIAPATACTSPTWPTAGGGHADAGRGRGRDRPRLSARASTLRTTRTRQAARCTSPAPPGTAGALLRDDLEPRARDLAGELAAEALREAEVELADGHERRHRDRIDAVVAVVLDERVGRTAEAVDRLRVLALGRGRQPLLHDALVVDLGREAPEVDDVQEVAQVVRLLRRPLPAADDLAEEVVAAAVGAVEDEAAHLVRMRERELLRDRAAHRRADDVRALDAERVHQRRGVLGEVLDAVLARRRLRLPDAAVVERRDAPAVAQARDLIDPARALVGEAGDEDDVVALPACSAYSCTPFASVSPIGRS